MAKTICKEGDDGEEEDGERDEQNGAADDGDERNARICHRGGSFDGGCRDLPESRGSGKKAGRVRPPRRLPTVGIVGSTSQRTRHKIRLLVICRVLLHAVLSESFT